MVKKRKKKLRIAQVAPLWFPVPPKKYGGSERIISFLTEYFVKQGHQVTLFASGDSKTKAKLVSPIKKGLIDSGAGWDDYWWNTLLHADVFEKAKQFDIIHCHWTLTGAYFQKLVKTPVIHTLHNIPGKNDLRWRIFQQFQKELNLVFISKSEKSNAPLRFKNSWVIYNGIHLASFPFKLKPQEHFIWVARVCPAKGPENAIKIAQKAGIKLLMAGQIQRQHQKYFQEKIKPRLNSQIKFVGELTQKQLAPFYARAKACLYPINWQEPFGLVMAESMACGTPIIAFDKGSAREVVKHGQTGFVVKNIEEAVKAVKKIEQIKRKDCRAWVENNFSLEKMAQNYEKLYRQLIS